VEQERGGGGDGGSTSHPSASSHHWREVDQRVEHAPSVKSQLASHDELQCFMWCKFGHVTPWI
jgi:hypothetical protein